MARASQQQSACVAKRPEFASSPVNFAPVNLQALELMLRDTYLADAVLVLGSIDIIMGEVDR